MFQKVPRYLAVSAWVTFHTSLMPGTGTPRGPRSTYESGSVSPAREAWLRWCLQGMCSKGLHPREVTSPASDCGPSRTSSSDHLSLLCASVGWPFKIMVKWFDKAPHLYEFAQLSYAVYTGKPPPPSTATTVKAETLSH